MGNYLKVYLLGLLSTWMALYGLVLLSSQEWLIGTPFILIAGASWIEILDTVRRFDRQENG